MLVPSLRTFFAGGFECSSQRRRDGRRLDLLASTKHGELAAEDYEALKQHGIRTVRDGLRWHLIERSPRHYDWGGFLPMLRAANRSEMQVIWDLCHYGWPDDIDIWSAAFVERFADFAAAAASIVANESNAIPFYCPVNEISFWAWAACHARRFQPAVPGRGGELKRQLVRATIAATEAIRSVDRRARFVNADPLINVVPGSNRAKSRDAARGYHLAQYETRDMLVGALAPELGGKPEHLDILGVNYYPNNQWMLGGKTLEFGHPHYRALRELLAEAFERYHRPLFVSETGAEGSARAAWLFYVCEEVKAAIASGVPIDGICLYPVLDYPGWENARHCEVGLLGAPDGNGRRSVFEPLAAELMRQQSLFVADESGRHSERQRRSG
jgi:beta-glucosidase/6-phospho-beta-glucosidase/beta-galactosidase